MHLKQWLLENNMTQQQFAEEIGYLHTYLSNCLHQRANPGRKFFAAVERVTKGQVTRKDWPTKKEKENKNQMDFDFDKPRSHAPRDASGKFMRKA